LIWTRDRKTWTLYEQGAEKLWWSIWFIWFVWSIWFVLLLDPEKPNKPNKQDKPNNGPHTLADFFNSLLDSWAGIARMLCDSGRSNENCLRDEPLTLKLRENPRRLIPFEIDDDHESMSSMMAPVALAVHLTGCGKTILTS